jgi:sugar porter (SP) family MFS transporter
MPTLPLVDGAVPPSDYRNRVAFAAFVGGVEYGFVFTIIAGAGPPLSKQFDITSWQLGLIVGNLSLGAAIGAALAGPLADRIGRKWAMLATALLFVVSSVATTVATSIAGLLIGRGLAGLAVGALLILPLYVAEVAAAKSRGFLVSLVQIGIVTGILVAFGTGWGLVEHGPESWRWMFALGVIPAVALLAVTVGLPESPRWLAGRGDSQAALQVLTSIVGREQADDELRSIKKVAHDESGTWIDLCKMGSGRVLAVGVAITILSVTVGINAVLIYGPAILAAGAGQGASESLFGAVVLGCVNLAFTLVALATIDRLGRRPLLVVGLAGMGLAMLWLGWRSDWGAVESAASLLVPIVAFVAFYAVSLGPVTWVIVAEIFPTKTRGAGMGLCMIVMYLADFLVTLTFPSMMEQLGSGSFLVFAAISALGMSFVLLFVPETKGKSLEEIESLWSASPRKEIES